MLERFLKIWSIVKCPQMGLIILFSSYGSTQVCVSLKLTLPLSWSARSFIVRLRGGQVTNVLTKVCRFILNGVT
jgi:ABC-type microcin C transport system permease subunit YejE